MENATTLNDNRKYVASWEEWLWLNILIKLKHIFDFGTNYNLILKLDYYYDCLSKTLRHIISFVSINIFYKVVACIGTLCLQ